MNRGERTELVLRHLERAYRAHVASQPHSKELEHAIVDAIALITQFGFKTTI